MLDQYKILNLDLNSMHRTLQQSSKLKFEFTGPNQILEFILIYILYIQMYKQKLKNLLV